MVVAVPVGVRVLVGVADGDATAKPYTCPPIDPTSSVPSLAIETDASKPEDTLVDHRTIPVAPSNANSEPS